MISKTTGGIIGHQISNGRKCSIIDIMSGTAIQTTGLFITQSPSYLTVMYEQNGTIAVPNPAFDKTIAQIPITDFKAV